MVNAIIEYIVKELGLHRDVISMAETWMLNHLSKNVEDEEDRARFAVKGVIIDAMRTLGVSIDDSYQQIKEKYRKKSFATHPNKPGGSENVYKKVSQAWVVLNGLHDDWPKVVAFLKYNSPKNNNNMFMREKEKIKKGTVRAGIDFRNSFKNALRKFEATRGENANIGMAANYVKKFVPNEDVWKDFMEDLFASRKNNMEISVRAMRKAGVDRRNSYDTAVSKLESLGNNADAKETITFLKKNEKNARENWQEMLNAIFENTYDASNKKRNSAPYPETVFQNNLAKKRSNNTKKNGNNTRYGLGRNDIVQNDLKPNAAKTKNTRYGLGRNDIVQNDLKPNGKNGANTRYGLGRNDIVQNDLKPNGKNMGTQTDNNTARPRYAPQQRIGLIERLFGVGRKTPLVDDRIFGAKILGDGDLYEYALDSAKKTMIKIFATKKAARREMEFVARADPRTVPRVYEMFKHYPSSKYVIFMERLRFDDGPLQCADVARIQKIVESLHARGIAHYCIDGAHLGRRIGNNNKKRNPLVVFGFEHAALFGKPVTPRDHDRVMRRDSKPLSDLNGPVLLASVLCR